MDRINKGLLVIAAVLVAFSAFRLMQGGREPVQLLDIPALVAGTLPQHRVTKLSPLPAGGEELTRMFTESMTLW